MSRRIISHVFICVCNLPLLFVSRLQVLDALSLFDDDDEVELRVQNRLLEGLKIEAERLAAADVWPRTVTLENGPHLMKVRVCPHE